jgi:hypothetical protein
MKKKKYVLLSAISETYIAASSIISVVWLHWDDIYKLRFIYMMYV